MDSQMIQLIALDLDGTLYNSSGRISNGNKAALRRAIASGVTVIISTGRPYVGLPVDELNELGIRYAITSNGSAIYHVPDKKCIYEDAISNEDSVRLLSMLYRFPLHLDAFINGDAYTQRSTRPLIDKLRIPESLRTYIRDTRTVVDDLPAFIAKEGCCIQKVTVNFVPDDAGNLTARDDVTAMLEQYPQLHFVSGGFRNIEINKSGISKAKGLRFLCELLQIPIACTFACGDSENDYDILTAAGIGAAMANSEDILLQAADFVSRSNDEDGVAYAIDTFLPL